ncbi:MAG TPA: hypothetical protein VFU94_06035 [Conexibacter sp.]|nr:hypothetical protein [Conexibacter sp.]
MWRELTLRNKPNRVAFGPITCSVTMEGSFHERTFAKTAEALIGAITRAIAAHPCEGGGEEWAIHNGTETVLRGIPATSLPWPIRYVSFTGTLPLITTVTVNLTGIVVTATGLCLETFGEAAETRPWVFRIGLGGVVNTFEPAETHLIRPAEALPFCTEMARLGGVSGPVTQLGTTTQIAMRLI